MREVIVGTAGHIDHGKTTLVKALTGIDTDRLKEEKRRGITIDIGFAHLEADGIRFGFIDVPGHQRFVKNMLCGVGGIDLVMLVVAADESVMPQTVEHFNICRLLGIERGIAVLTKKNSIEEELLDLVEEEIRDLGAGTFLAHAPIVAVDSLTGEGIDEVRRALAAVVGPPRRRFGFAPSEDFSFRMPVDRVFSIRGFGTVATGTPLTGTIAVEAPLHSYPGKAKCKVRGIEIFNGRSEAAAAGQRAALNLASVEKSELERGMVLASPATDCSSFLLDVEVSLLSDAPGPLRHRAPIRFHHGSAERIGRLHLFELDHLTPGEKALGQIRLDAPAACLVGDRFVLRRYSPMVTVGGGIILDPQPKKHLRRTFRAILPELRTLSASVQKGGREALADFLSYALRRAGPSGLQVGELAARSGLLIDRVQSLLAQMESVCPISQTPALAVSRASVDEAKKSVLDFLTRHHDQSPLSPGVPAEEVRRRTLPGRGTGCFPLVLEELIAGNEIEAAGGRLRLADRQASLDSAQEEIREQLMHRLEQGGLNPPTLDQLCRELPQPDDQIRSVFFYLLNQSHLVRVSNQIVLTTSNFDVIRRRLAESFPAGTAFSVAQFRDLFGISRKYAIPYLEYLDSTRVTLRMGDQRMLR